MNKFAVATLAATVAIVIVVLVAVAMVADYQNFQAEWARESAMPRRVAAPDYKQMAIVLAPKVIKLALKHPLDATFTDTDAGQDHLGRWLAYGHVKSPNGFGLPLTSEWIVAFKVNGDKLSVDSVVMDGKHLYQRAETGKQVANSP